jgi:hypothetical protein
VAVSFIGGGNQSTWRKLLTNRKSLTNFIGWFMVFNATFNNISAISWRSVLLVEDTGIPGENH